MGFGSQFSGNVYFGDNDDNAPIGPLVMSVFEVVFPEQAAAEAEKN